MNHHTRRLLATSYEENDTTADFIDETKFVTFYEHQLKDIIAGISYIADVSEKYIKIEPCHPVGEDCVYIHGKWSGYVDEWGLKDYLQNRRGR